MLTLSFKDANNNIAHVATAICHKKNAKPYTYLLENTNKLEPLGAILNSETTACFTDGHKGSDVGLPALVPCRRITDASSTCLGVSQLTRRGT